MTTLQHAGRRVPQAPPFVDSNKKKGAPMIAVRFPPATMVKIKRLAVHRQVSAAKVIRDFVALGMAAERAEK